MVYFNHVYFFTSWIPTECQISIYHIYFIHWYLAFKLIIIAVFAAMSAVLNTAFTTQTAEQFLLAKPISSSWAQDLICMVIRSI